MRTRLAILGSTGSIGANTAQLAALHSDRFRVVALSADSNIASLARQVKVFRPKIVSVRDKELAFAAKKLVGNGVRVVCGVEGLSEIATRPDVDTVVFATGGHSCLVPLLDAINAKKRIALANKEALVSAGGLVMRKARQKGVTVVPIDSEHSAIFQCIEGKRRFVRKLYLTGSGGPLLDVPASRFDRLSRKSILNHPKWRMGKKISVDSATMMNKALEVIEARWLFDVEARDIEVLIHPEAIVHSMVETLDGSVFAQMSVPDMRMPILYALTYPERLKAPVAGVDFTRVKALTFRKPDLRKFPCLGLASVALERGGTCPAAMSAADEEAVKCYLSGKAKFTDIFKLVEKVLGRHRSTDRDPGLNDILAAEEWAREEVKKLCYH
ncbi:MAG: 1-deoxy-D-xylulose-5-phosphate reductoisomerase [Candidatus Omnitrophica bacterium]|nr:1-deoxy-D-xylulose-5-phosphate reductoisomerase [Candidatus Omnitrophota bacterium]